MDPTKLSQLSNQPNLWVLIMRHLKAAFITGKTENNLAKLKIIYQNRYTTWKRTLQIKTAMKLIPFCKICTRSLKFDKHTTAAKTADNDTPDVWDKIRSLVLVCVAQRLQKGEDVTWRRRVTGPFPGQDHKIITYKL